MRIAMCCGTISMVDQPQLATRGEHAVVGQPERSPVGTQFVELSPERTQHVLAVQSRLNRGFLFRQRSFETDSPAPGSVSWDRFIIVCSPELPGTGR
jgi:hypothetical protein